MVTVVLCNNACVCVKAIAAVVIDCTFFVIVTRRPFSVVSGTNVSIADFVLFLFFILCWRIDVC